MKSFSTLCLCLLLTTTFWACKKNNSKMTVVSSAKTKTPKAPKGKAANKIRTGGAHHIGLTVKDLKTTAAFFIKALNFKKIAERPKYPAIFVSDGKIIITLWQAKTKKPLLFNRKTNIGLHHLALSVSSFKDLDAMYKKLKKWPGVKIQFSPELMGKGPTKHMMFYEPGGIRLELVHSPKK